MMSTGRKNNLFKLSRGPSNSTGPPGSWQTSASGAGGTDSAAATATSGRDDPLLTELDGGEIQNSEKEQQQTQELSSLSLTNEHTVNENNSAAADVKEQSLNDTSDGMQQQPSSQAFLRARALHRRTSSLSSERAFVFIELSASFVPLHPPGVALLFFANELAVRFCKVELSPNAGADLSTVNPSLLLPADESAFTVYGATNDVKVLDIGDMLNMPEVFQMATASMIRIFRAANKREKSIWINLIHFLHQSPRVIAAPPILSNLVPSKSITPDSLRHSIALDSPSIKESGPDGVFTLPNPSLNSPTKSESFDTEIKSDLSARYEAIAKIYDNIQENEKKIEEMKEAIQDRLARLKELQKTDHELDDKIASLREQIQNFGPSVPNLEEDLSRNIAFQERLQGKLETIRSRIDEQEAFVQDNKNLVHSLEKDMEKMSANYKQRKELFGLFQVIITFAVGAILSWLILKVYARFTTRL